MATAEQYAELDKEVRARLAALEAEVAEKNAVIVDLRAQLKQMQADTPTLETLARAIQRQKADHAAEVTRLRDAAIWNDPKNAAERADQAIAAMQMDGDGR